MKKIKVLTNIDPETGQKYHHTQYLYMCPGCGFEHAFALKNEGGHHDFNMDVENPTIVPSLVQSFTKGSMCHSFIRDGKIKFSNDCTHCLAGQTVELPEIK